MVIIVIIDRYLYVRIQMENGFNGQLLDVLTYGLISIDFASCLRNLMWVIWHVMEWAAQASNGPGKNMGISLAQRSDNKRFTMSGYYKQLRRGSRAIENIAYRIWTFIHSDIRRMLARYREDTNPRVMVLNVYDRSNWNLRGISTALAEVNVIYQSNGLYGLNLVAYPAEMYHI